MTWTYHDTLDRPLDRVRALIGDIDSDEQLLPDETITALLSMHGDTIAAAIAACEMIAALSARDVTQSVGGASIQASERFRHYRELADQIRASQAVHAVPVITSSNDRPFFTRSWPGSSP